MVITVIQTFLLLLLIVAAAEIFTNALEHFGQKIGLSEGVTGSIFAAVATALPETMIPVLALVAGTANKTLNEEISVGAILGAPLMLATLAMCVMALAAIKNRGLKGYIQPEKTGLKRDLHFFLAAFFLAALGMYVPLDPPYLRMGIGSILILIYLIYLLLTFSASKNLVQEGHGVVSKEKMLLTKLGLKKNMFTIVLQMLIGMILLILGAKGFIHSIEQISNAFQISPLLLSLIIIPIATELPEKVNSVIWIQKNKDTLAMGNLTGAMVFQGTLLPALGILLTPWQPVKEVQAGIFITFLAAVWIRITMTKKGVPILALMINGLLYLFYLGWSIL